MHTYMYIQNGLTVQSKGPEKEVVTGTDDECPGALLSAQKL